ncbi:MAG: DUF4412 domain-containing protein [Bacteroidota bacterium]
MTLSPIPFVLALLCAFTIAAQTDFEGTITYNIKFQDKTGKMTDAQAASFMGMEQTYYLKGNHYKSVMDGHLKMTQYYTGKDTLYSTMAGVNALIYIDAKQNKEKVISSNITKGQEVVAGYPCDVLEIKTDKSTTTYYFSPEIRTNPEGYANHNYGLWAYCLEQTKGALPLKTTITSAEMQLSMEAKTVAAGPLEDTIFELPKDLPLMKSPENR